MNTEERNAYITKNITKIASIVLSHTKRRGMDFDDTFQTVSEKLINYLDKNGEPKYLTQWIGNEVNKLFINSQIGVEEFCWYFEELYFPDFSKPFVISEWVESACLKQREKEVLCKTLEGYSLREIGRLTNISVETARRNLLNASQKLRVAYIFWR